MGIKEYIKIGAFLGLAGLLVCPSCDEEDNIKIMKNEREEIIYPTKDFMLPIANHSDYELGIVRENPNKSKFSKIEWRLDNQRKSHWNSKELEYLVDHDKKPKPSEIKLTEWEMPSLSRLIPLKKTIENHAGFYGINPVWATMFFSFESHLNPNDNNHFSNDFGLGQIKYDSEKLAKEIGTNPKSKYYSPYLNKEKSIFDPETNIIMSMILNRWNIEKLSLTNSDQVYAIYVRGIPGINLEGSISDISKELVNELNQRYDVFKKIIPLFGLKNYERSQIQDEEIKELLKIYHQSADPKEAYKRELSYLLSNLESNPDGSSKSVLTYDDCLVFARTLDRYGFDQKQNYDRLLSVGEKIKKQVVHPELIQRFELTTRLLKEARYR